MITQMNWGGGGYFPNDFSCSCGCACTCTCEGSGWDVSSINAGIAGGLAAGGGAANAWVSPIEIE